MKVWIQKQYEDIKGHFKWFLLALLWTGLVWAAHHLTKMFNAPSFMLWSAVLIGSCVVFYLVARWQGPVQAKSAALVVASPQSAQAFDEMEKFFKEYSNPLMPETEANVRGRADRYRVGAEREAFLVTTCARLILVSFYEQLWNSIYKSQISALEEVNKHAVKIDSLQQFYKNGLQEEPKLYSNGTYSFTSWLAFLKGQVLIVERGDSVDIAPRGREFLKYLVHTRRSANERRG